jgi:hypothetical protein
MRARPISSSAVVEEIGSGHLESHRLVPAMAAGVMDGESYVIDLVKVLEDWENTL